MNCILGQTYSNFELLIADDASTDNTRRIIESISDARIKLYHNDKNIGYLRTWNKLIDKAQGEYITFLDADDLCSLNRIELLVALLKKKPQISVVGSNYTRITSQNIEVETSDFPTLHEDIFSAIPRNFPFIGSSLMIRKNVYEVIGGYNTFFDRMGAEDHYWVYRVLEVFRMENLKEALYKYRFNENSVSGNISNNPSKINVTQILEYIIEQRKTTGTDDLQGGNVALVKERLEKLNRPFIEDPSFYYHYVAKRRFYEGHKSLAIKNILLAISKAPTKINYYKDLFYFLRK
jgi:glycosyltransferase involved in cell wall biosynthesis